MKKIIRNIGQGVVRRYKAHLEGVLESYTTPITPYSYFQDTRKVR